MNRIYSIRTSLLWCTIAIVGCAQSADLEGPLPATSTTVSAVGTPGVIVTGGLGHSCAAGIGSLQCWGANGTGQLGDNSINLRVQPVQVLTITTATTSVSAGAAQTCAAVHGAAVCWGANGAGQLGNGAANDDNTIVPDSHVPVDVTNLSSGVQAIAVGDAHSCAIVNGAAQCWGINNFGEIGDGVSPQDKPNRRSPRPVSGLVSGVQAITAGASHSCAIANGAATCWGLGISGQLGNSMNANSNTPVPVTNLGSGVQAIAAGQNHTCALAGGVVKCWGSNSVGQLGVSGGNTNAPVTVNGLGAGVVAITVGQNHSCAITAAGAAMCWGSNSDGQLGNGSTDPNAPLPPGGPTPVPVTNLTSGVLTIAGGYKHTCGTTASAVWCWGNNETAQLALDPNVAGSRFPFPQRINGLLLGGCADGTDEQVFNNAMVGCAGSVTFANRATLCAAGFQPATALQWTSNRGGVVPLHNYWTNDPLRWSGDGTSACTVSLSIGNDCNDTPMRVCTDTGSDAEGNVCNWQHCGLYANAPDNFFGGCVGNTNAGTACIPIGSPANACTSVKSCPKWENGIVRIPASGATLEPTTTFGAGVRHLQSVCRTNSFVPCGSPTITGSINGPAPQDCQAAADARSNQLKSAVASSVAAEGSFDSVAALNQRSAEAQNTVGATRGPNTIQQFNITSSPIQSGLSLFNWDERWMCQLNAVDAAPATAPNDACGCNS